MSCTFDTVIITDSINYTIIVLRTAAPYAVVRVPYRAVRSWFCGIVNTLFFARHEFRVLVGPKIETESGHMGSFGCVFGQHYEKKATHAVRKVLS